jgi:hypothetical protein
MTNYDADPRGRDPGTALRASMGACVSGIRMPASLLDRAVSRDRKRRTRIRLTGTAAAAAAMAAAAVVIATVPGPPSDRTVLTRPAAGLQAQDAAFVLSRAAAAQVNEYHMISVDRISGISGVIYTDVATGQQRTVSGLRDSSGGPYFQIETTLAGGAIRETDVEYQHRVWSTFITSSMDPDGTRVTISEMLTLPLQTNADPAVAFRKALKAGTITVAGHRNLNGRDTILLRVKSVPNPRSKIGQWPASWIWIDASTYLVVQTEHFIFRPPVICPPSARECHVTWKPVFDHVTWLSPTRGNLALLTVTPPAGFTKIPASEMDQKYLGPIS